MPVADGTPAALRLPPRLAPGQLRLASSRTANGLHGLPRRSWRGSIACWPNPDDPFRSPVVRPNPPSRQGREKALQLLGRVNVRDDRGAAASVSREAAEPGNPFQATSMTIELIIAPAGP